MRDSRIRVKSVPCVGPLRAPMNDSGPLRLAKPVMYDSSIHEPAGFIPALVGVGMTITNHPFHRSGRALLTHPTPALGDDAKSPQGIRVMDSRRWQPSVDQSVHPLPRKPRPLAPSSQRPKPEACYLKTERRQRLRVRRHTEVAVVPFNHSLQPFAHLRHRLMTRGRHGWLNL